MKFCREPVATVTGKVAGSCGWCNHGNHPQWPSDAERENVEKRAKKNVCLRVRWEQVRQMKRTASDVKRGSVTSGTL